MYILEREEVFLDEPDTETIMVDIALTQAGDWAYIVLLQAMPDEYDDLHDAVFVPAVDAFAPASANLAFANDIQKHAKKYTKMIKEARNALRNGPWPDFPCLSDQRRGIEMPPAQLRYNFFQQINF